MKFTVEQITESSEEEVFVKCYDTQTVWVENIHKVVSGQNVIGAYKNGAFFVLKCLIYIILKLLMVIHLYMAIRTCTFHVTSFMKMYG